MLLVGRVVVSLVILGGLLVWWLRSSSKKRALQAVPAVLDALRAGFAQTRSGDESEPVCVVAFQRSFLGMAAIASGVTNRRVLVVKGTDALQSAAYDYDGEHLPAERKDREQRGFFHWKHSPEGYCPTVTSRGPFYGEQWLMPLFVQGFPQQKPGLREFSKRFYFRWFYD